MNVLVLMAGRGQRFVTAGYETPKPLIEVKGKSILQWTTESCAYIKHYSRYQYKDVKLYFAVLQKHLESGLDRYLYSVYGKDIDIIPFKNITRGNLDTALISCKHMFNLDDDLLVLDSDNKYNDNNFVDFINKLPKSPELMAVTCFDNPDKSIPNKWSNVILNHRKEVVGIREKDNDWVQYPSLVGAFYFAKTEFFMNYASYIIDYEPPVEFNGNKEYYMSMVPAHILKINSKVYAHEVTNVVPLGTPEDVEHFAKTV